MYTPFYPPSMLQAWTPTTSACYDLSTVFVANGLAPHAYGTSVRPNYHSSKSSSVRNKGHISRKPHYNAANTNTNTNSHMIFTNSSTNVTNANIICSNSISINSNNSNGTTSPANSSTNGSVVSTDYIANNTHYVNVNAKHFSIPKTTCTAISTASNPSCANTSVVSEVGPPAADELAVVSPSPLATKDVTTQSHNCSSKSQIGQSVDNPSNRSNSPMNSFNIQKNRDSRGRPRKKREDNDNANNPMSDVSGAAKPSIARLVTTSAAHTEPFELKANLFPPLPSFTNICSNDNKDSEESAANQCSSLADVVKGTSKSKTDKLETKTESSSSSSKSDSSRAKTSSPCLSGSTYLNNVTKTNCVTDVNSNPEEKESEEVNQNLPNSNSKVSPTSHDSDHCQSNAIPAILPNHCPSDISSTSLGSELSSPESKEKSNAMSTPIVLNGINDSFSMNSDSFDENYSHSSASATQTQPGSPNCVSKGSFDINPVECNGNDEHSNDGSVLDESSDSAIYETGSAVKRLTYAEIALRSAKDKINQNNSETNNSQAKEKDTNNSIASLKASAHLTPNGGRPKLSKSYRLSPIALIVMF